mgnify:FL=1
MKQLFNISSGAEQSGDLLLCELSHYHICLAGAHAAGAINWLQYYEKATPLTRADLVQLLQQEAIYPKSFKSLLIGSAFPDATLVPSGLAAEKDLGSFLNQQADVPVFTDEIEGQDVQVVYAIPAHFYNILSEGGNATTMHVHTAALRAQETDANNYMLLHFASREFRVVAVKEGQVQLAQVYPFTAPLDVVYYLLMISTEYNLPQSETTVYLSGLVDASSALYKELYQYYTKVQFAADAPFSLPQNDYQQHFFSSIFNLAACASSVVS